MNLDGWVFDDDDDGLIAEANISAAHGNTIVPAGGVAVLYPGDDLDFMPQRFLDGHWRNSVPPVPLDAWGGGISLIPVNGFTPLTATDAIGLRPSHAAYQADAIPMSTMSPRRTFASAAAALDFSIGFPSAGSGRSIAWSGGGNIASGANWVESAEGQLEAFASVETSLASAAINSIADTGNPGVLPSGLQNAGVPITEIMFNPLSPAVTTPDYAEADFEWVEILNNTANPINFAATNYVFDDTVGELDNPNITEGILAVGEAGVLFNSDRITAADMETMWGGDINFIPVSDWPSLNNDGDTIALWDSMAAYDGESIVDNRRGRQLAAASVQYDTRDSQDWPTSDGQSSIYLNDLTASPDAGESWTRSGSDDDDLGSRQAEAILQTVIDHPGGDVGSPGFAPGSIIGDPLFGDYNENARVDAADYTVWRDRFGAVSMPNDLTPGSVGSDDYDVWKSAFGTIAGRGSAANAAVPEPASVVMLVCGLAIMAFSSRDQWAAALWGGWGRGGSRCPDGRLV